jgi:hypothetical protein
MISETGNSLRQNALDPGFHGALTGPARRDRGADGAGVSGFLDVAVGRGPLGN